MATRIQKKVLSKMSNKSVASKFVDDKTGQFLDCLHSVTRQYCPDKKEAEKKLRHLIKIVVKAGLMLRQNQLNSEEKSAAEQFQKKFRRAAMTLVSFHEVAFSFDKEFLSKLLEECRGHLKAMTRRHMTDKNQDKLDGVFRFYGSEALLEAIFTDEAYAPMLNTMVSLLNEMVDTGAI